MIRLVLRLAKDFNLTSISRGLLSAIIQYRCGG